MLVDANGPQITSRRDEPRLAKIASDGGGQYFRYDGEATAKSLADGLRAMGALATTTEGGGVSPDDRYQVFLAIAVVLLIVDWLIDERRRMPRPRVPRARATPRRRVLGAVGSGLLLALPGGATEPIAAAG